MSIEHTPSEQIDPTYEPNAQHHTPDKPTNRKPLRLWPGVIAVVIVWIGWFVMPRIGPEFFLPGLIVALVGIVATLVWWLFFSRASWLERLGAIALMIVAVFVTKRLVHPSIATGAMGLLLPVMAIPVLCLALVAWAVAMSRLPDKLRRVSLVAAIVVACGVFTLIRTDGITGDAGSDFHLRWTKTPKKTYSPG